MSSIILLAILAGCTISLLALGVSLLVVRRLHALRPPDQPLETTRATEEPTEQL